MDTPGYGAYSQTVTGLFFPNSSFDIGSACSIGTLLAKEFDRLVSKLTSVELVLRDILYLPGEVIEYVYFPADGIVSLLTMLEDGSSIEVGVVGLEGMVGVSAIMGVEKATNEALVQEFMSHMLGVRRAGVSVAANTLRQAGLIDYQRGGITVLNRHGLEEASCECYRTIEAQSDGFHKN